MTKKTQKYCILGVSGSESPQFRGRISASAYEIPSVNIHKPSTVPLTNEWMNTNCQKIGCTILAMFCDGPNGYK